MRVERYVFPFSAIVGQERMKLALLLNAINPKIGGVLIRGEKGTCKSTAVRALARLLPEQDVVVGCRFGCDPWDRENLCYECKEKEIRGEELKVGKRQMRVVELPINASEDRVVGSIDIEAALKEGSRKFEPGVLAEANRNILYVDEVNLLDDHIVDVLLDAAAMGVNVVEREGVSISHPSRFILVGTMNPEEGEIRPQLLDRFGLCVDVQTIKDVDQRVEIVVRRGEFEEDPEHLVNRFAKEEEEIKSKVQKAVEDLNNVQIPRDVLAHIARLSVELDVDGHRGDLVCARAAQALAAYEGEKHVSIDHVRRVATMVYMHRVTASPLGFSKDGFEETVESKLASYSKTS